MSPWARRLTGGLLILAAAPPCAGVASAEVSNRVMGGAKASIADHPWQVAITLKGGATAFADQFCAGVLIDSRHVVTAAHCLDIEGDLDEEGYPIGDGVVDDAAERQVVAGATDLGAVPAEPTLQSRGIASWRAMPDYPLLAEVAGYDAALVTLDIPFDTSAPGVRPAVLVASGQLTGAGATATVSGWGRASGLPAGSRQLQAAELLTVSDNDCRTSFPDDLDPDTMLCAIAPGRDSCGGDSGGPLTRADSTVIGLVSWGARPCASGPPGVYTELAQPQIAQFVRDFEPAPGLEYSPPVAVAPPQLIGTAASGETLSCTPGSWGSSVSGEPERGYHFQTTQGIALSGWSASPSYVIKEADAGQRVVCIERARDASGASIASSSPTEAVAGPPPPPAPQPVTPPARQPVDTLAPRVSFVSVRCSRRSCRVRVRVIDRGATVSGVKEVRVTALPSRGRARVVTARPLGRGLYEARFKRLARGAAWFSLTARDRAGNRPARIALRRARVR